MLHTKSNRRSLLKLLALIPIVAIALAVNAEKVVDVRYDGPQKQITKKGRKNATINMGDNKTILVVETDETKAETPETNTAVGTFEPVQGDVFDVVEEMPQYPGGAEALLEFLNNNVQYPEEAEKAGIQGRVIATFVVEKDGSVSNAKVVKSVNPLLDAEALRVISAMPKWKPGKQNGKVVNVKYTVPISFRLDGKTKEAPTAVGIFTPTKKPTATGTFTPAEPSDATVNGLIKALADAAIDKDGNVSINGKPIKMILVDGKRVDAKDLNKVVNPKDVKLEMDNLIISVEKKK